MYMYIHMYIYKYVSRTSPGAAASFSPPPPVWAGLRPRPAVRPGSTSAPGAEMR